MAETLSTLSTISFTVAVVFFLLSVFLCFLFKIPTVISDLTGRTARKSIAKMRSANEKTGAKPYRESRINAERGKLTATMHQPRQVPTARQIQADLPETGMFYENQAKSLESSATDLLNQNTTALLNGQSEPASLSSSAATKMPPARAEMRMLDEVLLVHTDEVIR